MDAVPQFSEAYADCLARFLSAPERPEGTMPYEAAAGLLFAVACSPEIVPPSEWLPLIFNEKNAEYGTMEEAGEILQAFLALYNHMNAGVREGNIGLPPGIEMRAPAMANLDEDAPLSLWAKGFGAGHNYLSELWDAYTPEELDDELGACVMVLSFFVSRRLAETFHKETKTKDQSLAQMAESMLRLFPDAMNSYAHLGWSIHTVLQQHGARPDPAHREKIGRNDPCPCGSGKKYKKCCDGSGEGVLH